MQFSVWFILFAIFTTGCVKEDASISKGDATSGTTTGSTSGGTTGSTPILSDPLASEAWHLENTGSNKGFSLSAGTIGKDINVKSVHGFYDIKGRGVRIAVSDSGVETSHADLSGNMLAGEHRNYVSNLPLTWWNADPTPDTDEAHGTMVSGLVAALGWNGIGSRGVAPEAKVAGFKFIYDTSSDTYSSRLAKEIDQLYGNFDIFNFSYGKIGYYFVPEDQDVLDAIKYGVTSLRGTKGTNYVQSAGNSQYEEYEVCDVDVDPRCLFKVTGNANAHEGLTTPYKIVVGATNANDKKSSYSTPGSNIWISAPGGEYGITSPAMVTTDISGCSQGESKRDYTYRAYFDFGYHPLNLNCDFTNRMNGTSSAAPVTSGVVALMLEARPALTWRDVKHILATTANKVDYDILNNFPHHPLGFDLSGYQYEEKWLLNKAGILFSNYYGFGRVNAGKAVAMAKIFDLTTLGTFEQTMTPSEDWYYKSDITSLLPILDKSSIPAEDSIWVGHNYIIEAVQIKITSSHPFAGDLAVHLVSPMGTESRLLNINNKIYGTLDETVMLSNAFYGEESNGYWTIKIYDGDDLITTGNLTDWEILISGHKKSTEVLNPYPPTGIEFDFSSPPVGDETPVFSFTPSASTGVIAYEAAVGNTPNDEGRLGWSNIGLGTTARQLTGLNPIDPGVTYYLKLRTVTADGVSSVQVKKWTAP